MPNAKRILLVDDEPDIVKVTAFRLKKAGYEVLTAEDGGKGLEMARKEKPDLILLDWNLPVMGGFEVCPKLKADPLTRSIPIVIFSASREDIVQKSKEIGADDYLIKPFEPVELFEKVKKHLA